MTEHRRSIDRNFRHISEGVAEIEARIDQKFGFWVVQMHDCTKDQLLSELSSGGRIFALTEQFGSDVQSWDRNGKLNADDRGSYQEKRSDAETKLHEVRMRVIQRQPTGLEQFVDGVNGLIDRVLDNLPDLTRRLLPQRVQRLLGVGTRGRASGGGR
jgi:hypothetical protein